LIVVAVMLTFARHDQICSSQGRLTGQTKTETSR